MDGETELEFVRTDTKDAAKMLNIQLPKNLGDLLYWFSFRAALPDRILNTQPDGMEWVIELSGKAVYSFRLIKFNRVLPLKDLLKT